MTGATPKDVVEDYAYLTGPAPLTPKWALGFQQSRWSYMTQVEAQGIADRLRNDKIPADVLWLDIDYQDRNRPFTVDKKAYPDLPGLVSKLDAMKMKLVVITDLHIASAPNQGYAPYDSGMAADVFMKNPDGTPFVGPVWPGPAVFPDFTRAKARDWWGRNYAEFVRMGVAGFWNDMNEPAVFNSPTKTMPIDVVNTIDSPGFKTRKTTRAETHNITGLLNACATYDGVKKLAPDRRPFVMTRASYAGGQRCSATWTGDNTSSWAHLSLSTTQLASLGLSGFSYAGADIGGFAGNAPSPELLTRWIEIGAFNPIMRDHYQKGKPEQEVWVHGAQQENIRRRYIEERYRLMPYLYGLAEENSRTGLPLMRPVVLEYPAVVKGGDRVGGTEDQFMLGRDLLIAPPQTSNHPLPTISACPESAGTITGPASRSRARRSGKRLGSTACRCSSVPARSSRASRWSSRPARRPRARWRSISIRAMIASDRSTSMTGSASPISAAASCARQSGAMRAHSVLIRAPAATSRGGPASKW